MLTTTTDKQAELLADTMIVAWYVLAPEKLSDAACKALEAQTAQGRPIFVSSYSVVELTYMLEKAGNGITDEEFKAICAVLEDPSGPFVVIPMDHHVARGVASVPRAFAKDGGGVVVNADPGDRVIAATAVRHDLQVVTSDKKIHALAEVVTGLTTVW